MLSASLDLVATAVSRITYKEGIDVRILWGIITEIDEADKYKTLLDSKINQCHELIVWIVDQYFTLFVTVLTSTFNADEMAILIKTSTKILLDMDSKGLMRCENQKTANFLRLKTTLEGYIQNVSTEPEYYPIFSALCELLIYSETCMQQLSEEYTVEKVVAVLIPKVKY